MALVVLTLNLSAVVAFLLGETERMKLLKDPGILKRRNDINNLDKKDTEGILFALDGLLRDAKSKISISIKNPPM